MTAETWRPAPGFETHYEVSDLGRVRRLQTYTGSRAGMFLKPRIQRGGYRFVTLRGGGIKQLIKLHRLVLETFVGPMPDGHEINHRNGDKADNSLTNLEYVTRSQNIQHGYDEGLWDRRALALASARLNEESVRAIRVELAAGTPRKVIAARFGVTKHAIADIALGRSWSWLK